MKHLHYVMLIFLCFISMLKTFAEKPNVNTAPEPNWVTKNSYHYNSSSLESQADDGIMDYVVEKQVCLSQQSVYSRRIKKILSETGVQNNSDINIVYDPTYQQLIFHTIQIIRGNKIINQLNINKIKVVHQEEDLQKFIYNGNLTAMLILEDVRKGDIIEYSYSIKGFNPIFHNIYTGAFELRYGVPVYNMYYKLIVPDNRNITYKNYGSKILPIINKENHQTIYEWKQSDITPLTLQDNTLSWFDPYECILISEYKTWKEVNDLALSMFPFNIPLSDGLKNKIEEINRSNPSVEEKIAAALRFVQDEVRYMGIEMGVNSHKPHTPDQVFKQRFGDCKDKSYLLCTILRNLGIKADPVLINTTYKKSLLNLLPSFGAFDHTTVKVTLDNKSYFFDPTISYQRGPIKNLHYPDYQECLVLSDTTSGLSSINYNANSTEHINETFNVPDMTGNASLIVITDFNGSFADDCRSYFKSTTLDNIKKEYIKIYSDYFEKIKCDSISYSDNEGTGQFETKEYYSITDIWGSNSTVKKITFEPYSIYTIIKKPKEKQRTMPFSLSYPANYTEEINVNLPESWESKRMADSIKCSNFFFLSDFTSIGSHVSIKYKYENLKDYVDVNECESFNKNMTNLEGMTTYYISKTYSDSSGNSSSSSTETDPPGFPTLYFALGLCVFITYMVRRNRRA